MLSLLLGSGFLAHSQIEKGNFLVGGNLKVWQHQVSDENLYQIEISIDGGYMWHKYFASGLRPSFAWEATKSTYSGVFFTRFYYPFKTVAPFLEGNVGYGNSTIYRTNEARDVSSISESRLLGARLGAAFFIAPKVTFDVYAFYDGKKSTVYNKVNETIPPSKFKERSLGLGLGFQIFL